MRIASYVDLNPIIAASDMLFTYAAKLKRGSPNRDEALNLQLELREIYCLLSVLTSSAEPVRHERKTGEGWLVVEAEDIPHYQGRGQQIRPLYAAPPDQTTRIAELEQALSSAASQLDRVYNDAFKQAAGFGLVTSDGRDFSCLELNNCSPAAAKARSFIKPKSNDEAAL